MKTWHSTALCVLILAAAIAAGAQVGPGMGMSMPGFRGVWNPVVGSGGTYEIDTHGGRRGSQKVKMDLAIVGKEDVEGKPAFWLEYSVDDPNGGGRVYMKQLVVVDGDETRPTRMIVLPPQMDQPMEMPMQMMQRGPAPRPQATDFRKEAEKVGTEPVTTSAGTFDCEHFRSKDGTDLWIAAQVPPWGLVKMTSKDADMTLTKVLTNVKTRITGKPMMFDPSQMMRPPGQE